MSERSSIKPNKKWQTSSMSNLATTASPVKDQTNIQTFTDPGTDIPSAAQHQTFDTTPPAGPPVGDGRDELAPQAELGAQFVGELFGTVLRAGQVPLELVHQRDVAHVDVQLRKARGCRIVGRIRELRVSKLGTDR